MANRSAVIGEKGTSPFSLLPTKDFLFIEPMGDSERYPGSQLYIPASHANPEVQQGIVTHVHYSENRVREGDHVLFHPFSVGQLRYRGVDLYYLPSSKLVCKVENDQIKPFPTDVVAIPDERARRDSASRLVLVPNSSASDLGYLLIGDCVGIGSDIRSVRPGDRIIMEPERGAEVGWIDTLYYILPEENVLARLENNSR